MPGMEGRFGPISGFTAIPGENTGANLPSQAPGTWQKDPGIMKVASQYWGSPGPSYNPGLTHMTSGPYAGYSRTAVGMTLRNARSLPARGIGEPSRMTMGPPQASMAMGAPSASNPKRLWNYSFRNIAPWNTTLGRMRMMYGAGRSSSAFFR